MLILGIDTATARSSVALCDGETVLAHAASDVPRNHGEFVAPAVAACLKTAGVQPHDLDVVAVDVGPGLYTGMRVGIGFGQSLAFATGARTVPVLSTDALAYAARDRDGDVLVALDGRRGEVFVATYTVRDAAVQPVRSPAVLPVAAALQLLDGTHVAVVGDGFSAEMLDRAGVVAAARSVQLPDASAVALVAYRTLMATGMSGEELAPVYLRHADAKIGWETRGKRGHDGAA